MKATNEYAVANGKTGFGAVSNHFPLTPGIDNPQLEGAWCSDDNFERQARAIELAARKGCHPMAIASSYFLGQRFPIFALVGPATLEESARTFTALEITLTGEGIQWLNLQG